MSDDNQEPEKDKQQTLITNVAIGLAAVVGAIVLLIACPLAVLWALNGLFELKIPYDFWHWAYAAVLLIMLRADYTSPK
jgi:hypothetical protein